MLCDMGLVLCDMGQARLTALPPWSAQRLYTDYRQIWGATLIYMLISPARITGIIRHLYPPSMLSAPNTQARRGDPTFDLISCPTWPAPGLSSPQSFRNQLPQLIMFIYKAPRI